MDPLVLDTSVLLAGMDPPPGRRWATTPEAMDEIRPGGRDARRLAYWREAGLEVRSAGPEARTSVERAARAAGNLGRLSAADRSLLALALEARGTLWTNDHTMLDVARRLGVQALSVTTDGITATKDFRPRCTGCGRWFDDLLPDCPVCGSAVKARPVRRG